MLVKFAIRVFICSLCSWDKAFPWFLSSWISFFKPSTISWVDDKSRLWLFNFSITSVKLFVKPSYKFSWRLRLFCSIACTDPWRLVIIWLEVAFCLASVTIPSDTNLEKSVNPPWIPESRRISSADCWSHTWRYLEYSRPICTRAFSW